MKGLIVVDSINNEQIESVDEINENEEKQNDNEEVNSDEMDAFYEDIVSNLRFSVKNTKTVLKISVVD